VGAALRRRHSNNHRARRVFASIPPTAQTLGVLTAVLKVTSSSGLVGTSTETITVHQPQTTMPGDPAATLRPVSVSPTQGRSTITHAVVIFQESRSFDRYQFVLPATMGVGS
jgi:phospholipase C